MSPGVLLEAAGTAAVCRADSAPVEPFLPSINGHIDKAYIVTVPDGPAVSGFAIQDVTDRVHLTPESSNNVSGGLREVALQSVEYYEDWFIFHRRRSTLTADPKYSGETNWFSVGAPPDEWAAGRYVAYVYAGEHKVAEVEFDVAP